MQVLYSLLHTQIRLAAQVLPQATVSFFQTVFAKMTISADVC
jgi:hypothetical protein